MAMYAVAITLTILNTLWVLIIPIGLPGTWLILLSAVVAQVAVRDTFSIGLLVAVLILALLGELVEFLAGSLGTRGAGGSRRAAVGALLGSIAGGILGTILLAFIPLLGSLIGACVGAATGAVGVEIYDGRGFQPALRIGAGAGLGRLGGTVGKLAVGVAMWLAVNVAAFWP